MLDESTRSAILRLSAAGHGTRAIARALKVSRNSVKRVLRDGSAKPNQLLRATTLDEYVDQIRELYLLCAGNRVRVHEEVLARYPVEISYPALTAFCRRHGIGREQPTPVGEYTFAPGAEMQHDTSPHVARVAGAEVKLNCASLTLHYSRRVFAQCYVRFTRFEARLFLTRALREFGGAAARCIVDNTSVILAGGSGQTAVISDEMGRFARHFGFEFVAHEIGDADRKAVVERSFRYIEGNFYAGREFSSLADLNTQLAAWCERANNKRKRTIGATPMERFATEAAHLQPLPIHTPEVYRLHVRRVGIDGTVSLAGNRYSAPAESIGRRVDVREGEHTFTIVESGREIARHEKLRPGLGKRVTLPEHGRRRRKHAQRERSKVEKDLRATHPEISRLVDQLLAKRQGLRQLQRLWRFWLDYPTDCLIDAVTTANEYGLIDLARVEKMILDRVAGDYFKLP